MKISKIEDNKKRYMSLLFLADEQEDMMVDCIMKLDT